MPIQTPFRRLWPWTNVEMLRSIVDRFGAPLNLTTDESGYLRTAEIQTLLALKQPDATPDELAIDSYTENGGDSTYYPENSTSLITADAAGDLSLMQTRWYINYQPGKPQYSEYTFVATAPTGTAEVGHFDNNDGIFFRRSPTGDYVVHRAYGSDVTAVPRESWNRDKLDGTGPSGETIDFSTMQRMFIRFTWLGVGDAELGFVVGETPCVVHRFDFRNSLTLPFMRTPSLPLRISVADGAQLRVGCATCGSIGGQEPLGFPGVAERLTEVTISPGTTVEIASVRLAASYRTTVFINDASVGSSAANVGGVLRLLWKPTMSVETGWGPDGTPIIEHNISGRTVTDPGRVLHSEHFTSATKSSAISIPPILPLAKDYEGNADEITLAVYNAGVTAMGVRGSLGYRVVP